MVRTRAPQSTSGRILDLPEGPLSAILAGLSNKDLTCLIQSCWSALQLALKLTRNVRPMPRVVTTASSQVCKKLLAACKRQDIEVHISGFTHDIMQHLVTMQPVAQCVGTMHMTLMLEDVSERAAFATELHHVLAPLARYTNLTQFGVAVQWSESDHIYNPDPTYNQITKAAVALKELPAIKELVLLEHNQAQTVVLVNTLCKTVARRWRNSIKTLRICHNFGQETVPFNELSLLKTGCRIIISELHLPFDNQQFAERFAPLLNSGRIALVPNSVQSFHLHAHLHAHPRLKNDGLGSLSWVDILNALEAPEPCDLHVVAEGIVQGYGVYCQTMIGRTSSGT